MGGGLRLLVLLLLLCCLRPCRASDPADGLPPWEECMSLPQLAEAVTAASWNATTPHGHRSTVILTTCDTKCLRYLFEPFIWAMENSRDGDFSQHLIIVGNGMPAYLHCDRLRRVHKHYCVLDRWCTPPGGPGEDLLNQPNTAFQSPKYAYALLQKVAWAAEVVKLGAAVLWADMDVSLFANPMKFLLEKAPDADVILNSEVWGAEYSFEGDLCQFPEASRFDGLCKGADGKWVSPPPQGICCQTRFNGGLWLISPTARGSLFVRAWLAFMFEDALVRKRIWNGSCILDQDILGHMVAAAKVPGSDSKWMDAPVYKWDGRRFVGRGNVVRSPEERIYQISGMRVQSLCGGQCGWKQEAGWIGYWADPDRDHSVSHWRGDGYAHLWLPEERPGLATPLDPAAVGGHGVVPRPPASRQLVCLMPRALADGIIAFHQNCIFDSNQNLKRENMFAWANWTVQEPDTG